MRAFASLLLAVVVGLAQAADLEVGRRVPAAATAGIVSGKLGTVLVTYDAECPVSQRYVQRVGDVAKRYTGYRVVLLDLTPAAPSRQVKGAVRDPGGRRAALLGATTTAEAFVIDSRGTLRYRGAIDDQYGISHQRARPVFNWLADAMLAVSQGGDPATPRTQAAGCALPQSATVAAMPNDVTYHNTVSRIVQTHCEGCHRAGGLGPMPLQTYAQVAQRREVIAAMVTAGRMPPWSANPHIGTWANDRSLSEAERRDLLGWIKAGAPEGSPADAPLPRRFTSGWNIGQPDAVISIPQAFDVPAHGTMAYKYVYVKTAFPEDRWVTAVEVRPTAPAVVHHAIVVLEEPGKQKPAATPPPPPRADARPQPGGTSLGFFAATVPGSMGMTFPAGAGKLLPTGAWLVFEIHYQPNGKPARDRTMLGLKFSKTQLREIESRSAVTADFVIPPGRARHPVQASYRFCQEGQLLSLFPHMHLRGSAFQYELQSPGGERRLLLDVPKYDFAWQSHYQFREPLKVAAGSLLTAKAWYDNSPANPWNPDPKKEVRWGPQVSDEMMIGYFDFLPQSGKPCAP